MYTVATGECVTAIGGERKTVRRAWRVFQCDRRQLVSHWDHGHWTMHRGACSGCRQGQNSKTRDLGVVCSDAEVIWWNGLCLVGRTAEARHAADAAMVLSVQRQLN